MILKTKVFQELANKVLIAADLDKSAANLELIAKENYLFLNVTNKEYYVSIKYQLEKPEEFQAVVDASLFLNLISSVTTETFELDTQNNLVLLKTGKSNYKLAMIYENNELMKLPIIYIKNKTVEMNIENSILQSILNVNSKEIAKAKKIVNINELQKLYYIDQDGAFTFTDGACLNSFKLEKPIKLLLNDRIVKLFKLFSEDVKFSFGYDMTSSGNAIAKAAFETADVYVAAKITCDDLLLSKIQGPCNATKNFINATYANNLVISTTELASAISRLLIFSKKNTDSTSRTPATIILNSDEITIQDEHGNIEVVVPENESYAESNYKLHLNLFDLKLVLDSCKNEHITLNCGNHRSVIIHRGTISHVIPELREL